MGAWLPIGDEYDTAPHYGCGTAERVLAQALAAHHSLSSARIYTKVGRRMVHVRDVTDGMHVDVGNVPTNPNCAFPGADKDVVPVLDYTAQG